jgi:hypothetical protein
MEIGGTYKPLLGACCGTYAETLGSKSPAEGFWEVEDFRDWDEFPEGLDCATSFAIMLLGIFGRLWLDETPTTSCQVSFPIGGSSTKESPRSFVAEPLRGLSLCDGHLQGKQHGIPCLLQAC